MRSGARIVMLGVIVALTAVGLAQGRNALEVYFIDVEGGQATLFVSPSGESMLVDAGFPGLRDGERIGAATDRRDRGRLVGRQRDRHRIVPDDRSGRPHLE